FPFRLLFPLFSLRLCRRSLSPLFPYTTLFRSFKYSPTNQLRVISFYCLFMLLFCYFFSILLRVWLKLPLPYPTIFIGFTKIEKKDRKSTRLNSSHDSISYAVFCLKKKNKQPPD